MVPQKPHGFWWELMQQTPSTEHFTDVPQTSDPFPSVSHLKSLGLGRASQVQLLLPLIQTKFCSKENVQLYPCCLNPVQTISIPSLPSPNASVLAQASPGADALWSVLVTLQSPRKGRSPCLTVLPLLLL